MTDYRPASRVQELPLIVITGPTASGKTGLALKLAEQYGGEIICADSRTVYRGMDIGTAKPTKAEQRIVPHHLLDVVEPSTRFTAADFQHLAREAINDIRQRGRIPFLVGGTGLYIDSVILDYRFGPAANEAERQRLSALSHRQLQQMLIEAKLPIPENPLNKRQLIRVWEQAGINHNRRQTPDDSTVVVAIATDKNYLDVRIRQRASDMFAAGVLAEAQSLAERYGWESEAMTGNIYPLLRQVLDGQLSQQEAIEKFVVSDRRLAKRQITWLKRHQFVHWLSLEAADDYLQTEIEHRT